MFRFIKTAIRRRPKTTFLAISLALCFSVLAGGYGYAFWQWREALFLLQAGRSADARLPLQNCLWFWPRSTKVHILAARAARQAGDFAAAEELLARCKRVNNGPTQESQIEFLLMRAQAGEVDDVAPVLYQYVDAKCPESSLILESISQAYMHQLRYGPAHAAITRWIGEFPDLAKAYHWRGWILERMDQHRQAMIDYRKALELDPELDFVRLRMAEILLEDKQPLEALPHLERLWRKTPNRPEVLARLGQCRFLQGQKAEARRLLEEAVKSMPDDSPLLVHLARLELEDDRPVEAERWLRHALTMDAGDPEALYTLVSSLQLQGRREEAAQTLRQFEKQMAILSRANQLLKDEARNPSKDPNKPFDVGNLLLEMGHERLGIYWLNQALLRDPQHAPANKALADYYEKKGKPEKAAQFRPAKDKG